MQNSRVSHFANLFVFIIHTYLGIIHECYGITGYFCLVSGLEMFWVDVKHLICHETKYFIPSSYCFTLLKLFLRKVI